MNATLDRTMPLSDRVKELRHKAGHSQEVLAQMAGITVSSLRKIEQGSVPNPQWLTIRAIARALDVSLDEISDKQDDPPAKTMPVITRRKRGPLPPTKK